MLRVILSIIVGTVAGIGLGWLQSSFATSGYEERFTGSRTTLAEARGEKTNEELVQQSTGTPKVEVVGGTEFNFGTMLHGDSQSHSFVFRNIGDGPLNLDMGSSTCKCTVGELKSSILKPGEETEVTLTWNAISIAADYGQSAVIHTNAPDTPEVQLRIRGKVTDSYVIEPSSISLSDFAVTDQVSRKFHVFTYLKDSTQLMDFKWSDEKTAGLVDITCKPVELDKEKFPQHLNALAVHEVEVTVKPGLNIGQLNSRITFATDKGEKVGTLELPVTGRVSGDIVLIGGPSFDPKLNILKLGTIKSSQGGSASISLSAQGELRDMVKPEIVSVKPSDSLKVTVSEPKMVGQRRFFTIKFEVPKGAPEIHYAGGNPRDFGKVVIKTNHEITEELSIFVQLNVVK